MFLCKASSNVARECLCAAVSPRLTCDLDLNRCGYYVCVCVCVCLVCLRNPCQPSHCINCGSGLVGLRVLCITFQNWPVDPSEQRFHSEETIPSLLIMAYKEIKYWSSLRQRAGWNYLVSLLVPVSFSLPQLCFSPASHPPRWSHYLFHAVCISDSSLFFWSEICKLINSFKVVPFFPVFHCVYIYI